MGENFPNVKLVQDNSTEERPPTPEELGFSQIEGFDTGALPGTGLEVDMTSERREQIKRTINLLDSLLIEGADDDGFPISEVLSNLRSFDLASAREKNKDKKKIMEIISRSISALQKIHIDGLTQESLSWANYDDLANSSILLSPDGFKTLDLDLSLKDFGIDTDVQNQILFIISNLKGLRENLNPTEKVEKTEIEREYLKRKKAQIDSLNVS